MLNINELLGDPKVLSWNGQDYPVIDPTLEETLKIDQIATSERESEGARAMLEVCTDIIKLLVPGLPIEEIPVRCLEGITSYVMGNGGEKKTVETMES